MPLKFLLQTNMLGLFCVTSSRSSFVLEWGGGGGGAFHNITSRFASGQVLYVSLE